MLVLSLAPVACMRWVDPPTSAFMIAHRLSGGGSPVHHRWVDRNQMAPAIQLAVVAAEDQKFAYHGGFDFDSIRDALVDRGRGEPLRGASTISQQTAKNLFLWQGRSFLRKGLEAWFTVLIEALWPKTRILEVYLNVAEFGRDVYGVGAAAERFFGKTPGALDDWEASMLATVMPSPRRMDARRPSPYMYTRSRWVRVQMRRLRAEGMARALDLGR